jgi:glycogen debranching enzyme
MTLPFLETDHAELNRAFRIALGDIAGNIFPDRAGLMPNEGPCFRAGLDYPQQWTRDNAINTWNGGGLLYPEVGRNSLLAVLGRVDGEVRITGEYWDSIIWAQGAWAYYLFTGDREFLRTAREAVANTLRFFETTEFDERTGLFRGSAAIQDGVAAFPDRYADIPSSGIKFWAQHHPRERVAQGEGLPMMALSTNCIYVGAYRVLGAMAAALGEREDAAWARKADALAAAVRRELWDEARGVFRFFTDPWGGCDRVEGVGHAFAILFGVADATQREAVFRNQHVAPAGLPSVWPSYERYTRYTPAEENALPTLGWPDHAHNPTYAEGAFGRHSGVVWPPLQAFWAEAAARHERADLLGHELLALAKHACRDGHFSEIYHPITGGEYGGVQEHPEGKGGMQLWASCARQTWSETAFVRMVLNGVAGAQFAEEGVRFAPVLPAGVTRVRLGGVRYRAAEVEILVSGAGARIVGARVNGVSGAAFVPASATGPVRVEIEVAAQKA